MNQDQKQLLRAEILQYWDQLTPELLASSPPQFLDRLETLHKKAVQHHLTMLAMLVRSFENALGSSAGMRNPQMLARHFLPAIHDAADLTSYREGDERPFLAAIAQRMKG